mmetsp:Transcript_639/g.1105  ORF Transcript_639/g.1105 Transcript_639/m.1105 type:complete len:307 (-) Transcript_639:106-1026(-)
MSSTVSRSRSSPAGAPPSARSWNLKPELKAPYVVNWALSSEDILERRIFFEDRLAFAEEQLQQLSSKISNAAEYLIEIIEACGTMGISLSEKLNMCETAAHAALDILQGFPERGVEIVDSGPSSNSLMSDNDTFSLFSTHRSREPVTPALVSAGATGDGTFQCKDSGNHVHDLGAHAPHVAHPEEAISGFARPALHAQQSAHAIFHSSSGRPASLNLHEDYNVVSPLTSASRHQTHVRKAVSQEVVLETVSTDRSCSNSRKASKETRETAKVSSQSEGDLSHVMGTKTWQAQFLQRCCRSTISKSI